MHNAIAGQKPEHPPFWFMRQAGRYLPEYREIRAMLPHFLDLCYHPQLAAQVTLQPVKRFDMDAAIIFSDILVIPDAMGVGVSFEAGEGPKLQVTRDEQSALRLNTSIAEKLEPVMEAIRIVRAQLSPEKSLIGFCGAPWTVACYMVAGKSERDYESVRVFALADEKTFSIIIDKLIEASVQYLSLQVKAGADIIQIFDSWAGVLPETEYRKWVITPAIRLISQFKKLHPDIPVIAFPRGSGIKYPDYALAVPADVIGIDVQTPLEKARTLLKKPLQGNLDPVILAYDKCKAIDETRRILDAMQDHPFIFNLGHGILPATPLENVEAVCKAMKEPVSP